MDKTTVRKGNRRNTFEIMLLPEEFSDLVNNGKNFVFVPNEWNPMVGDNLVFKKWDGRFANGSSIRGVKIESVVRNESGSGLCKICFQGFSG